MHSQLVLDLWAPDRKRVLAELDQLTSRLRDGVDQLVQRLAEVEATTGFGRKGGITRG